MKKRIFAMLLCVSMVLALLPGGIAFSASAETTDAFTDTLSVDQDGKAFCPACNATVTWTAFAGNAAGTEDLKERNTEGVHYHYYLSADVNARNVRWYFLNLRKGNFCLHLNGHDLYYGGYIMVGAGAVLNIMGAGNAVFTDTNKESGYDNGGLYANTSSTINLYGGTYSVAENALDQGKPTIQTRPEYSSNVVVKNAKVLGTANISNGVLTLDETAQLENIQIASVAKLYVKSTWTGSAQVAFAAALQNNVVPAANGGCEGEFTGQLKMAHGVVLNGAADGKLTASGFNANLVLDENSQALCPACNKTVTWTVYDKSVATISSGEHHFYLDKELDARKVAWQLLNVSKATVCLHLNGNDLYYGGYLLAGTSAVVNIMGSGNMVFTATNTNADDGCTNSGLYVNNYGTINLYGGTHTVAEDALAEGKPMLYIRDNTTTGKLNILRDAIVYGLTNVPGGTLTIGDGAQVENIQVGTAGKLVVKSGWSGTAKAAFAAELQDNLVPAANGSGASFTGELTLPNGNKLQANASGRLVETGLDARLVPDADSQALCEACQQVVTWTAFTGNAEGSASLGHRATDGVHYHYYLTGDVNAKNTPAYLLNLLQGDMCLHLNGFNLYHGGYILVAAPASLNIMGAGGMIFTATNKSEPLGYVNSALFVRGTVTLYSGTYEIAERAVEMNIPTLVQDGGAAYIMGGVSVKGQTEIRNGTVTVQDTAKLENVRVNTSLIVKDSAAVTGNVELRTVAATVQGPEGLNVTASVGDTVVYSAGKYSVHSHSFGDWVEVDETTHKRVCAGNAEHEQTGEHAYENGLCVCGKAAPEENEAQLGEEKFKTLQEALNAAKENGGTVKLLMDAAVESHLILGNNVTLDLNGKKLTVAENCYVLACYEASFIIDSSENNTGRLVAQAAQLRLLENNLLPVQLADGIMFVEVKVGGSKTTTAGKFQLWLQDGADQALIDALKAAPASQLGLKFQAIVTWGNNELKYTFQDATVALYMEDWQNLAMYLKINGGENYEDLAVRFRLAFADATETEVFVWSDSAVSQ